MSFYADDLAHVHDTGWGEFARTSAPGVVARLRAAGLTGGLVVDLACGSGILSRALVDAGYDVLGVDISPHMLEIARGRVPEARFVAASVVDVELPECDAVVCIGEGLGYLEDPRLGDDARLTAVFARVRSALRPGAPFLFDLVEDDQPRHAWFEGDDYVLCLDVTVGERRLQRRIVLFRCTRSGRWRRSDELHAARLQPREEVLAALAAAGFTAEVIRGYADDAPLRPGVVGYLARA